MKNVAFAAASSALFLAAGAAFAGPLTVTSYDMPNGDGQASGGSFNYWDGAYSGSGATTTDGAALNGGLGKLTDGFVSTLPWYAVSNNFGTGDYVGWYGGVTRDPLIAFHFAGPVTVGDVKIQLDNSGVGGVFAPARILVDGVSRAFTAPAFTTVGVVDISGLHLTGATHTIEFDQPGTTEWTFVSEISFFSGGAVPEPASWALVIGGMALTGAALRRRATLAA